MFRMVGLQALWTGAIWTLVMAAFETLLRETFANHLFRISGSKRGIKLGKSNDFSK